MGPFHIKVLTRKENKFIRYTVTILFMYVIISYVLVIGGSSVKFNNLYYF